MNERARDLFRDHYPLSHLQRRVQPLRRCVEDLISAIVTFIDEWNDRCCPFAWAKTAE